MKKYCVLSVSKTKKKRTETLNYRPSKFFLCSFVQRENPFFFHLFHHRCLKDTRRKEKEKRDRERDTHKTGARGKVARERERERDDDDDDEGRER